MTTRDRAVLWRLKGDPSDLVRATVAAKAALASLGTSGARSIRGLHQEIDKTNDRTAWLAQGILALAPAVTTLGAGAVPVLSGLATQMTVGAGAAGVMALGFNGIGDALGALNDYQLDPTTENLEQLNEAMDKVGASGEQFVRFLDSAGPAFAELADTARGGMFPGIQEGIESFMTLLPQVNRVVAEIASGIGQVAASAGADLAGPEWEDFWNFLESDARHILVELSTTIGNFIQGMGSLIVAFAPVSRDFSAGFEDMSRSFANWAAGVDETQGFQDFLAYVREAGPLALDFLGSLVMAFAEIVEAAAPVGAIMLPRLTNLLDVIASLADTPLGPLVLGFTALTSAWGRLNALAQITGSGVFAKATQGMRNNLATAKMLTPSIGEVGTAFYRMGQSVENQTKQTRLAMTQMSAFGRAAAPVAGQIGLLAFSITDLDNRMGLTNTAMLTLAGSMMGPWGAAIGAAVGFYMDLSAASNQAESSIESWQTAFSTAIRQGDLDAQGAAIERARTEIDAYAASLDDFSLGTLARVAGGVADMDLGKALGTDQVGEMEGALADLESQYERNREQMGAPIRGFLSGLSNEAVAAARASKAQERHATALQQARAAARSSAEAFVGLGDKLDESKVSLDAWIRDLQRQADALRNFRENAETAANKGLRQGLIDALHEAGPAGAMRMKQLANATEEQIARANRAWQSQRREVNLMGQAINALPDGKHVGVTVSGLRESTNDARELYNALANIRSKTVSVTTVFTQSGRRFKEFGPGAADGITVPKTGLPYADRHWYELADGEEVISNRFGQADRHRDLLKAINANRLADGGTVGQLLAASPSVNVAPAVVSLGGARFVLEVPGMGRVMTRVVRTEMAADQRFNERLDDRD